MVKVLDRMKSKKKRAAASLKSKTSTASMASSSGQAATPMDSPIAPVPAPPVSARTETSIATSVRPSTSTSRPSNPGPSAVVTPVVAPVISASLPSESRPVVAEVVREDVTLLVDSSPEDTVLVSETESTKVKEKEPLLISRPHSNLIRTTSLAQMAREHKLAQESGHNDTRKFYDVSQGLPGPSGDADTTALGGHLSRGGSPSPSISRHQSYTRLDDAALDYLGHRSHHRHHHHQYGPGHDAKEDTNLMFRTGSKIFNNSGFELGIRDDWPAWGSRHASRHASQANSRVASRRGSQQYDDVPNLSDSGDNSDEDDSVLHMGRRFKPSGRQSDSDSDSSSQPDDSDMRHWSSLADTRLIRWTDKLLGLGGQDSITGLREFLQEPNKVKPQMEKRRYREQSILTDPVLVLALSTLLTN